MIPTAGKCSKNDKSLLEGGNCRCLNVNCPCPDADTETLRDHRNRQLGGIPSLLVTDKLIRLDTATARARLITAHVQKAKKKHGKSPTQAQLARESHSNIKRVRSSLREARDAELIQIRQGATSRINGKPRRERDDYLVNEIADPRLDNNSFVILPLTPELGNTATHQMLRAVFLRQQAITGAIQIPLDLAARYAGMTPASAKKTISKWTSTGKLTRIAAAQHPYPATYILDSHEHPANLERFDPKRKLIRTITATFGATPFTVWGSRKEIVLITTRCYGPHFAVHVSKLAQELGRGGTIEAAEMVNRLYDDSFFFEALDADRERDDVDDTEWISTLPLDA